MFVSILIKRGARGGTDREERDTLQGRDIFHANRNHLRFGRVEQTQIPLGHVTKPKA